MGAKAEHIGRLRTGEELVRLCSELEPCAEGKPHWIHVLPLGPHVEARDGRKFTVQDARAVVAASELPMLVDREHNSEAGDTDAYGWIEELKVEPADAGSKAGVWGRVEWTPHGHDHVAARRFRFLSPVVVGKRSRDKETLGQFFVERMTSVALTNRPALRMHGIEMLREQLSHRLGAFADTEESENMDKLRTLLCTAFGLATDSSDETIANTVKPIVDAAKSGAGETASLREAVSTLTKERNEALSDKTRLETELEKFRGTAFKQEVEVFFAEGARAGKIPPAAREQWLSFALKNAANFQTFKDDIFPGLPVVVGGRERASRAGKGKTASEDFQQRSRHGVDRAALKRMGLTEEQILESEREVFERSRGPGDEADDDDDDGDDGAGDGAGDEDKGAAGAAGEGT